MIDIFAEARKLDSVGVALALRQALSPESFRRNIGKPTLHTTYVAFLVNRYNEIRQEEWLRSLGFVPGPSRIPPELAQREFTPQPMSAPQPLVFCTGFFANLKKTT